MVGPVAVASATAAVRDGPRCREHAQVALAQVAQPDVPVALVPEVCGLVQAQAGRGVAREHPVPAVVQLEPVCARWAHARWANALEPHRGDLMATTGRRQAPVATVVGPQVEGLRRRAAPVALEAPEVAEAGGAVAVVRAAVRRAARSWRRKHRLRTYRRTLPYQRVR